VAVAQNCPVLLASANVNGIRAAVRRGGLDWLAASGADVLALQEVRADADQLTAALASTAFEGWTVAHAESVARGRAGVAVVTGHEVRDVRTDVGGEFAGSGRWVEADLDVGGRLVTVASVYVHTGEAGPSGRRRSTGSSRPSGAGWRSGAPRAGMPPSPVTSTSPIAPRT
jgi:exodeoxyribonuclease-3